MMLSDREIKRLLNIPIQTIQDWKKKEKDNWRYKTIHFLKSLEQEEIIKFLEDNKIEYEKFVDKRRK